MNSVLLAIIKDFVNTALAAAGVAGVSTASGPMWYVSVAVAIAGFILSALHVGETSALGRAFSVAKEMVAHFQASMTPKAVQAPAFQTSTSG